MNNKGFTLVEMICVLLIIGVLAAICIPKFIDLQPNAEKKLINMVIAEMNARENMAFLNNRMDDNATVPYDDVDYSDLMGVEVRIDSSGFEGEIEVIGGDTYPIELDGRVNQLEYTDGVGPKKWEYADNDIPGKPKKPKKNK